MAPGDRSQRASQAAATRQALIDAALELFAVRGYDATTTEEISAAAGVSPRTFFRHFPTKESVLLFGRYDFIQAFVGLYLAQADELGELDAVEVSLLALAPGLARIRDRIRTHHRVVASSPYLQGREKAGQEDNTATVAHAIATRRGLLTPDASCQMLAAITLVVLDHATTRWLDTATRANLGTLFEEEFTVLRGVVCGSAFPTPR